MGKENKSWSEKKKVKREVEHVPNWDRFRGTMLYPLSSGELAMKGEQILRLYVISIVCTVR